MLMKQAIAEKTTSETTVGGGNSDRIKELAERAKRVLGEVENIKAEVDDQPEVSEREMARRKRAHQQSMARLGGGGGGGSATKIGYSIADFADGCVC